VPVAVIDRASGPDVMGRRADWSEVSATGLAATSLPHGTSEADPHETATAMARILLRRNRVTGTSVLA